MKNLIASIILLLVTALPQIAFGQTDTLYKASNYTIQSLAYEVDSLGFLWWKCDSVRSGELFTYSKTCNRIKQQR